MAVNDRMVLGRNRRVVIGAESPFGTYTTPANTGSCLVLEAKVSESGEKVERRDRPNRSLESRIDRKIEVDWEMTSYALPQGGTTPPDITPILAAAFGAGASGGGRYGYSINDAVALSSLTIEIAYPELLTAGPTGGLSCHYAEGAIGAVVNELEISVSGSSEPTIKASGPAISAIRTGTSYVSGSEAGGQTVISVNDARQFTVGSRISLGTSANNVNRVVSAVDTTLNTITLSTVWGAGALTDSITGGSDVDANAVYPYSIFDVAQCAGEPALIWRGGLTLLGTSIECAAATVKMSRGIKRVNDQIGSRTASFFIPGYRQVTGELTLYSTKTAVQVLMQSGHVRTGALSLQTISAAGYDMIVSCPKIELDYARVIEIPGGPDGGEAQVKIPFVALASTAGAYDELALSFGTAS